MTESKSHRLRQMAAVFFISTTCICIMDGIFGCIFFQGQMIAFEAYFSPPLFGLISAVLSGLITSDNQKYIDLREQVFRQILLLVLIEICVFGLNYLSGNVFSAGVTVLVAIGIVVIYGIVLGVMYLNEKHNAEQFNEALRQMQSECKRDKTE